MPLFKTKNTTTVSMYLRWLLGKILSKDGCVLSSLAAIVFVGSKFDMLSVNHHSIMYIASKYQTKLILACVAGTHQVS